MLITLVAGNAILVRPGLLCRIAAICRILTGLPGRFGSGAFTLHEAGVGPWRAGRHAARPLAK